MPPTLAEIAKRAGVSVAAVSKVINRSNTSCVVASDTADQIRKVANELGYLRNSAGKILTNGKTDTIGILLPDVSHMARHSYMSATIGEAVECLALNAKHLVVVDSEYLQITERGLPKVVDERRVDGVVLWDPSHFEAIIPDLEKYHVPWVAGGEKACGEYNCVYESSPIALAVRYLLGLGHRKFVYAHYDIPREVEEQRYIAIEKCFENTDATYFAVASPHYSGDFNEFQESWKELKDRIFSGPKEDWPTAVLADSNWIALAAMKAAKANRVSIPDDISIVGIGSGIETTFADPSLTTTTHVGVGRLCIEMLLKVIETKNKVPSIVIRPMLIERESAGPAAHKK